MSERSYDIWILEDDDNLHFIYTDLLNEEYKKTFFTTLQSFSEALKSDQRRPDLIIADITLDDGSFLSFIQQSENKDEISAIPFIVISGDGELETLNQSFEQGAFDYIVKPFKPNELIARINRILQKNFPSGLQGGSDRISLDDFPELTLKEFQILDLFMQKSDSIVKRDEMTEKLWKDVKVHPKTLDVHLHNLKRKIRLRGYSVKSTGHNQWKLYDYN